MRGPGYMARYAFLLCMLFASSRLAALDVFVQPETAQEGDIVDLILQYESEIPSLYALETEPLLPDFEVIDTQSRIQRLSGYETQRLRMQWIVKITPRRTGRLEIPPMRLGEMRSRSVWLDVRPRSDEDRGRVDVAIELAASPADPYVGQEVIVTMRLWSNTPLSRGRISEPAVEGSRVYRSTQDRQRKVNRGNSKYDLLERNLSLFADRPGELTLGAASFTGSLIDQPARQIIRRSSPLVLAVREPPPLAESDDTWLPASQLDLRLDWDVAEDQLKVGDSLGLELTMTAHGLPARALPVDLLSMEHPDFRIYPDEARFANDFVGRSIIGQLRQSFVFVAARAGTVEVPPVELTWWDTGASHWRSIELPARRIQVQAATPLQENATGWQRIITNARQVAQQGTAAGAVWLAAAGVIAISILIAFRLRFVQARMRRWRDYRRLGERRSLLRQACLSHDPDRARAALLAWARLRWPYERIFGLTAIAERLGNAAFAAMLARLDAAIYASHRDQWRGAELWRQFARVTGTAAGRHPRAESALPRLYPAGVTPRADPSP